MRGTENSLASIPLEPVVEWVRYDSPFSFYGPGREPRQILYAAIVNDFEAIGGSWFSHHHGNLNGIKL